MSIDAHTHVGRCEKGETEAQARRFIERLDEESVDAAVVLPLHGLSSNCTDHRADNEFIYEFCRYDPERMFPAFSVNPLFGKKALEEIERCRNERGLRLLKLHPWLQGFSVSSDEVNAVAELCEHLQVSIVFHDGTPPYSTPLQIARLCRDFPALTVVSGHAGLNDLWRDAVAAARRYPNYCLCLCGLPLGPMQEIVNEVDPNQICVGSDMIDLAEDLIWYRWNTWRRIEVSEQSRDTIENLVPRKLIGTNV